MRNRGPNDRFDTLIAALALVVVALFLASSDILPASASPSEIFALGERPHLKLLSAETLVASSGGEMTGPEHASPEIEHAPSLDHGPSSSEQGPASGSTSGSDHGLSGGETSSGGSSQETR